MSITTGAGVRLAPCVDYNPSPGSPGCVGPSFPPVADWVPPSPGVQGWVRARWASITCGPGRSLACLPAVRPSRLQRLHGPNVRDWAAEVHVLRKYFFYRVRLHSGACPGVWMGPEAGRCAVDGRVCHFQPLSTTFPMHSFGWPFPVHGCSITSITSSRVWVLASLWGFGSLSVRCCWGCLLWLWRSPGLWLLRLCTLLFRSPGSWCRTVS